MPTEADLQTGLVAAMKARDQPRVYVLRGLLTAIKAVKVERHGAELAESEIAALIRKEINKRNEALEFARRAQRADDEAANLREREILEGYAPPQLDADALEAAIRQIAAELGTQEIGPIMAQLKQRHAGQYDGKLASTIVKTKLGA